MTFKGKKKKNKVNARSKPEVKLDGKSDPQETFIQIKNPLKTLNTLLACCVKTVMDEPWPLSVQ